MIVEDESITACTPEVEEEVCFFDCTDCFSNILFPCPPFAVVLSDRRRFFLSKMSYHSFRLNSKVARHLRSELDCCCYDLFLIAQKQDGVFWEIVGFSPGGTGPSMPPWLTGLSLRLPNLASWFAVVALNCAKSYIFFLLSLSLRKEERSRLLKLFPRAWSFDHCEEEEVFPPF